jgi:hypothetical protein
VDVVSSEIVESVPIGRTAPKVVVPRGPDTFGRNKMSSSDLKTLSGRLSPLTSKRVRRSSELVVPVKPTLPPPEPCFVGASGLKPT